jgi:DnaK suppressor protein
MMGYLIERKQTMKAPATQAYRQTLERMREALLERMSEQRDGKVSRAEVAFEQFDHSQDDPGQINSQRDLAFAIDENEIAQLQAIDDALDRITQGVYGLCQTCGSALSEARLQAAPQAMRCAACQTIFETAPAAH